MKRIFILSFLSFLFYFNGNAAYLENIPRTLIQPNGDTLHCFATGDEYYNYLHDADGFTIVLNRSTGYYVYADKMGDELVPTEFVVGMVNPRLSGLRPYLNISAQQWLEKRNAYYSDMPQQRGNPNVRNFGDFNNLVVFIRFSEDSELVTSFTTVNNMFNDSTLGANSMINYYKSVSYNQLFIHSHFYPAPNGTQILSYQDSHTRNYYLPYSTDNTIGYNSTTERRNREHALLGNAINYIKDSVPTTLNIDNNHDGNVDNVCFVVKGAVGDWSELLWPHRWSLYSRNDSINGKRVYDYNFQLEGGNTYFTNSVLCHEMFHSLGAPDLYHYDDDNNFKPVDRWDVMGSNTNPPQHPGAYMKYEYGHWIQNIPEITQFGTYTLRPLASGTSNRTCYKIATSDPDQFYVLEYRKTSMPFEEALYGSGIIIYRINTDFTGNSGYDGISTFDEVYVFRPDGTTTSNGNAGTAFFSSNSGRTQFNFLSDPHPFLTDGTTDSLFIFNITASDSTISFTYGTGNSCFAPTQLLLTTFGHNVNLTWNAAPNSVSYSVYRDSVLIASGLTANAYSDTNVTDGSHCYYVGAVCNSSEMIYSEQECTFIGSQLGTCEVLFYMYDYYQDGWNGGGISVSYNDGTPSQVINMYSGEWDTVSVNVNYGTMVTLTWISGEWDNECSFTVAYPDGTLIYTTNGTPIAGVITSFTANCNIGDANCFTPQNLQAVQYGSNIVLTWDRQVDTILDESFEAGFPVGWQRLDVNNDASNWMITSSFTAHTGSRVITSASYQVTPDNWLITPQLDLATDSYLSFWVCAQDNSYFGEHYAVYISTTGSDTASFTTLLFQETINTSGRQTPWVNRIIDLSGYSGQVYIAFRHFNCTNMYYLNFDDIQVVTCPNSSYNIYKNNVLLAQNIDTVYYSDFNYLDGSYCYFVTGSCGLSESLPSAYACITFDSGNEILLSANSTGRNVNLHWSATLSPASYALYRDNILLLNTTDTLFIDAGLNCETTYCYRVEALYGSYSIFSSQVCDTTGLEIIEGDSLSIEVCGSYSLGGTTFENSGNYTVILPSASQCDSLVYLTLTVNDEYTVNEDLTICEEALPYTFMGATFTAAGVQDPIVLQSVTGCDSTIVVTLFTEAPDISISGNISIYLGETTELTASGAVSYLWSTGSTEESITVSPEENTTYRVTGTDEAGCTGEESATVQVSVSIAENELSGIFFPNPAQDKITVCGDHIVEIEIFDMLGKSIYRNSDPSSVQIINIEDFTSGVYVIRISTSQNSQIVQKLVISRK